MKLKPGEKVTLIIDRKVLNQNGTLNLSLLNPSLAGKADEKNRRRQPEFLSRRKSGLVMIFHDPTRKNTGTEEHPVWTDVFLEEPIAYDFHEVDPNIFNLYGFTNFDAGPWGRWKDKLFEIPIDDWIKMYETLTFENAEERGIDVYVGPLEELRPDSGNYYPIAREGSRTTMMNGFDPLPIGPNEKWKDPGRLELADPTSTFALIAGSGFPNVAVFEGFDRWKVTTVNDYSADDKKSSFKLDGECHIFPVPMPLIQGCTSIIFDIISPGELRTCWIYPGVYKPISRDHFLDYDAFEAVYGVGLLELQTQYFDHLLTDSLAGELADYNKTITGAFLRYTLQPPPDISGFPGDLDDYQILDQSVSYYRGFIELGFGDNLYGVKFVPGALQMVIITPDDTYYIWANETFEWRDFQLSLSSPV